jgi:2-polyprenyl-3-methyl-5-hydroxy-6-metoxy-1,4-benzoquinol methylase
VKVSNPLNIREKILKNTFAYRLSQNVVAPSALGAQTVNEYLSTNQNSRILDLGCGYGEISQFFPSSCNYLGVDLNASYIDYALRKRKRDNTEFIVGDVSDIELRKRGPFDLVFLTGVLHHLSADQIKQLVSSSRELVSESGRFVAIEPVFTPDQGLIARLIIAADRGRYVRDVEGYESLLRFGFMKVSSIVDHTRLRIPYSHVIISCEH